MANSAAICAAVLVLSALVPSQTSSHPLASRQVDAPTLYAEVQMDCAPWDGTAFSVAIQPLAGAKQIKPPTLHISIWQAPDLPRGGRFAFPDLSGKIGAVHLQPSATDSVTALRGTVSFATVARGTAVEGRFDLADPRGTRYAGKFAAKWVGQGAMCG